MRRGNEMDKNLFFSLAEKIVPQEHWRGFVFRAHGYFVTDENKYQHYVRQIQKMADEQ